jgi:predicted GNAT family N-acyltransferase
VPPCISSAAVALLPTPRSPDIGAPIPLHARVATSPQERMAAYGLRYRVYISEQGKRYPEADHAQGVLVDELDRHGHTILVTRADLPCGTVRANSLDDPATRSRYASLFAIDRFGDFAPSEMVVCSRLATDPAHRNAEVRRALFESIYRCGIDWGTRLCFAAVAPHLRPLFFRYGFREYLSRHEDEHLGALHRLVLVNSDLERLNEARSPFLTLARSLGVRQEGRDAIAAMACIGRNRELR